MAVKMGTYAWGLPPIPMPTRNRRNKNQLYLGAKVLRKPKYRETHTEMVRPCFTRGGAG